MARSARQVVNDHIAGGQANLARYRKSWSGSGVYVPPQEFSKQDERLLQSLLIARDVLENAKYGFDDSQFRTAVENWAALEWGGYLDRATFTLKERLEPPQQPVFVRQTVTGGT